MNKKDSINSILRLLEEETKKLKKKKKKKLSPVAITPFRRSFGSIFSMDAAVSMEESEMLSESIIKPITKKFDHLKWKLNDFQKQFLDDFINIPEESLRKEDWEYASKRTGIPIASIKSIRNTYADIKTPEQAAKEALRAQNQLGLGGGSVAAAKEVENDAISQISDISDLPKEKSGNQWSMNPNPEFRNKSLRQIKYEDNMAAEAGGGLNKIYERKLPEFMYEWLMYYIEGSEKIKIKESKLLDSIFSNSPIKYKYILFSLDIPIQENKIAAYDLMSNKNLPELSEFSNLVEEFNNTFSTNFIIEYQYTGNDNFLKVVLKNAQNTDGNKVFNNKQIDMSFTDEKRAAFFQAMKGIHGQS